ncbi:Mu-like prophage major head subunit gpT family protein [Rhodovulum marinum]|uniref:Phage major head subunit gpT-like protein n=1 Tax=Rhodovulum marinum TaxID=320662 RepID=A0A4R2Q4H5_9RHOB|nr:Mu-like prophage major head subunit gpT family protein [Rhodovulum marinum]TCP43359.1 phage major head subunit gpT-like protein [Rhodovulum marinum]
MIINKSNLSSLYTGFNAAFKGAFQAAEVHWPEIAMKVPSSTREEVYGWMGSFGVIREWIGPRHVNSLSAHSFTITNRDFEATVAVHRNDILDDRYGVFKPVFEEMGYNARLHPEELVMGLLADGFTAECYDGQPFFDTEHPVTKADGTTELVSNMADGSGPAWYLLDTSRAVRPLIFQEREPYTFESKTDLSDDNVFMNNEFLYGVRARANVGFGLWQLAYGCKVDLDTAAYAAARAAMMNFKSPEGRRIGVKPTTLLVPPELEEKALQLLNAQQNASGASNVWANTAKLIVSPFLSA